MGWGVFWGKFKRLWVRDLYVYGFGGLEVWRFGGLGVWGFGGGALTCRNVTLSLSKCVYGYENE